MDDDGFVLISLMESVFPEWDTLVVPGSRQGDVWTEVESLRTEFTHSSAQNRRGVPMRLGPAIPEA
jgi:hypothetical protein